MRRDHLIGFYRELAASDPALTLTLHRDDGAVLARFPQASVKNPPDRHLVLAGAFAQGRPTGLMRYVSPLDDDEKLAAWRPARRPRQPVTLMTGYADQLDEARRTGLAILAKPFDIDDLQRLLNGLPMRTAK